MATTGSRITPKGLEAELDSARRALVHRVRVELAREQLSVTGVNVGTAALGGLTKVARELERYFRALFLRGCHAMGRDPESLRREAFPATRDLKSCGPGQLGRLVSRLGEAAVRQVPELAVIQADLERKKSKLRGILEIRNEGTHVSDPSIEEARVALIALKDLISRI